MIEYPTGIGSFQPSELPADYSIPPAKVNYISRDYQWWAPLFPVELGYIRRSGRKAGATQLDSFMKETRDSIGPWIFYSKSTVPVLRDYSEDVRMFVVLLFH